MKNNKVVFTFRKQVDLLNTNCFLLLRGYNHDKYICDLEKNTMTISFIDSKLIDLVIDLVNGFSICHSMEVIENEKA